ncbi:IclR family transcriptional regulator [Streptomyces cocklensis]|uniref:Glycerol operon regulatory protein n=1 Tax=Actinacidiphila cocklensis TaxID=887465 RepID=A0A9W4GTE1_9ACTN|nr:IclR family transcriptional regulator [Actinacidiphila cocklensis]MDD1062161.1 IclR family transcriptional regulator [Actinacidiphila cocklensis]CAG6396414.1 Transcriptional regulator, IclR family [Actinacidiphila cocklensis]
MTEQDAQEPQDARSRPPGAQTVERAFDLLRVLRELPGPATAADIARRMDLNVSAVHRMARAMEQAGFLEQDPATRRYRLGTAIAGLNRTLHHQRRFDLARPELRRLSELTSGSAVLALRDGCEALLVADLPAEWTPDAWSARVTDSVPLHASAFGKALLAWPRPSEGELAALAPFERFTERTLTTTARLRAELDAAVERGYAVSSRELRPQQLSVAVPILDQHGGSYLALGVGTTWTRNAAARTGAIARQLQHSARRLREVLVLEGPR